GRGAAEAFREAEGCGQPGVEHYMRRRDGMPLGIDVMQPPGGGFGGGGPGAGPLVGRPEGPPQGAPQGRGPAGGVQRMPLPPGLLAGGGGAADVGGQQQHQQPPPAQPVRGAAKGAAPKGSGAARHPAQQPAGGLGGQLAAQHMSLGPAGQTGPRGGAQEGGQIPYLGQRAPLPQDRGVQKGGNNCSVNNGTGKGCGLAGTRAAPMDGVGGRPPQQQQHHAKQMPAQPPANMPLQQAQVLTQAGPSAVSVPPDLADRLAQTTGQGRGRSTFTFEMIIDRNSSTRLGIDVILAHGGTTACEGLLVERISEGGSVDLWNQQSTQPYVMRRGDIILEVNGISQNPPRMAREFSHGETSEIRFTVQRLREPARQGAIEQLLPGAPAAEEALADREIMAAEQALDLREVFVRHREGRTSAEFGAEVGEAEPEAEQGTVE
ncbi:unnamed protein product, partial [Prorocentrum cordatum]